MFLIAGAARYSFIKFLVADLLYAVFGVGLFFFFGTWIVAWIHRFESTAVFVAAILVMGYGLYMYYKLLRRREIRNALQPPISILEGIEGSVPEGQPAKNPAAAPAAKKEAKIALDG
ncbi:MAG: hypothetical protein HC869_27580 [Rhodospirillales bacterium]|nr:hypothetical protein [Rhodospirillales bacterium]